ncbi:MAG: hypothetical protein JOZ92_02170 [Candidatus Dormibacteraeota bacterium]|nr:hypothetical protein [Candidatus Dormibacteraeota bacterium]
MRGAVAVAEQAGLLREQAGALLKLSVYVAEDDPREAFTAAVQAAELSRRAGVRPLELTNLSNAAELSMWLGELAEARNRLDALWQRGVDDQTRRFLKMLQALLTGLNVDPSHALSLIGEAEAESAASEMVAERSTFWRARAVIELAAGDAAAAYVSATAAVDAEPSGLNTAQALAVLGRAALFLRDPERARTALSGMAGFRGRWITTIRREMDAGLDALEGRGAQAVAGYRRVLEEFRSLDTPLDLALCNITALLVGAETGRAAAAEARQILTRIGATPFLEQVPDGAAVIAAG